MKKLDLTQFALILVCIIGVGIGIAAIASKQAQVTPVAKVESTFRYGQPVVVKEGFYRDYLLVVLEEGETNIYAKIAAIIGEDGRPQAIRPEYSVNIKLKKTEVEPFEAPAAEEAPEAE